MKTPVQLLGDPDPEVPAPSAFLKIAVHHAPPSADEQMVEGSFPQCGEIVGNLWSSLQFATIFLQGAEKGVKPGF